MTTKRRLGLAGLIALACGVGALTLQPGDKFRVLVVSVDGLAAGDLDRVVAPFIASRDARVFVNARAEAADTVAGHARMLSGEEWRGSSPAIPTQSFLPTRIQADSFAVTGGEGLHWFRLCRWKMFVNVNQTAGRVAEPMKAAAQLDLPDEWFLLWHTFEVRGWEGYSLAKGARIRALDDKVRSLCELLKPTRVILTSAYGGHVPLIIWGAGIEPGVEPEPVEVREVFGLVRGMRQR